MTIDEIITAERDNAEFSKLNGHDKSADYHNHIAEWLEELKAYRENSNSYNKEDIELNRNAMYNKAIDDFADKIINLCNDGEFMNRFNEFTATTILEIAEQLKAGGNNE